MAWWVEPQLSCAKHRFKSTQLPLQSPAETPEKGKVQQCQPHEP